jgi:glycogen debranching enzyme
MSLEIKVGPPQLAIHEGHAVLLTEPDGSIPWPSDKGLYVDDTRMISSWNLFANGEGFDLLSGGTPSHDLARIFLVNRRFVTERGAIPARTLSLAISRRIGGGIHEDLDVTNHGPNPVSFNLEIALRSDFADIFEVKAERITRRGRIVSEWSATDQHLTVSYTNQDFSRRLRLRLDADTPAVEANGRLSFAITLAPAARWHGCLLYDVEASGVARGTPVACTDQTTIAASSAGVEAWRAEVLKIAASNTDFAHLAAQAIDDMAALRLPIEGTGQLAFVPAAGLPWFVALFGRDSLIVSLQTILVQPAFAAGALDVLGRYQATERDDHRDAEPGKIPHELRIGELAHFKLVPHTPYYGTADATPLYIILLHAAWRATGDRTLLDRHLGTAERCLDWIDTSGDRDGDGFQEYGTRSEVGYENQGWKDSGEALVHADGTLVQGPKALCELQGYVFDAWCRMAELYDVLGRGADARRLRAKAALLFRRFNEAFWMEDEGFYAFALDGEKRQVRSIASNPGHCLWSGIVPPARAGRVVRRLMQPDMWSGWGIRTLSSGHPSFNPHSYQCGSVWPHDNGLIALGFRRYGFAAEAAAIAHDVVAAGSFFALHQLPELYAGLQREPTGFPVQYVGANVPQAWAAGAVFSLLHALLGIAIDAPNDRLTIDPHLPDWLPDLTLRGVRLRDACFAIRFQRTTTGTTEFKVLQGDPTKVQVARFGAAFANPPQLPAGTHQMASSERIIPP